MLSRRRALTMTTSAIGAGLALGTRRGRGRRQREAGTYPLRRLRAARSAAGGSRLPHADPDLLPADDAGGRPVLGLSAAGARPVQFRFRRRRARLCRGQRHDHARPHAGLVRLDAGLDQKHRRRRRGRARDDRRTSSKWCRAIAARSKPGTWSTSRSTKPKATLPGLRPNVWLANLGDKYIDLAFRTAHRVDPAAELFINEYDLECLDGTSPKKREAFRKLIRDLLGPRRAAARRRPAGPHPRPIRDRPRRRVRFRRRVRSLGLAVHVTELDVIDDELPGPIAAARRHRRRARPRFPRRHLRRRQARGHRHLGHHRPLYLGADLEQAPRRPAEPAAAARRRLSAKPLWNVIDYYCSK